MPFDGVEKKFFMLSIMPITVNDQSVTTKGLGNI